MNSFETDLCRALGSPGFALGAALQLCILWAGGFGSTLYQMSVPVVCALPCAGSFIDEYRGGFWRLALPRGTVRGYIGGKFFSCVLSGAGAEVLAAWAYAALAHQEPCRYGLLFLSAMVWAGMAAVLAALSNSKYLAYGGGFVVFYFLVILHERYWPGLYCLSPAEWLAPAHTWPFEEGGTATMLGAFLLALRLWYGEILKERIKHG